MISLLSLVVNTIINALLYVVKAFFSMLTWFLKQFIKLLKYFYVLLPVTSVVFLLLLILDVVVLFTGDSIPAKVPSGISSSIPQMPANTPVPEEMFDNPDVQKQTREILDTAKDSTSSLFKQLTLWWRSILTESRGSLAYILLIVLTIIMFIPVMTVLLSISAFVSYGHILFFGVCADAVLYLVRAILGQTFKDQVTDRYYRLFKEAGKRHQEKNYEKWLKEKNQEIKDEKRSEKKHKAASFYDDEYEDEYDEEYDDYDPDEDYDDEYDPDEEYQDYDRIEDNFYEDDEEYDDEDYEEDFERDYDVPRSSFDFFAGCNSRESVDRKYKSLVKLYHPDNMDGDTAALQEINLQYNDAKKRF